MDIKLTDLKRPKLYVRGAMDPKHVRNLARIARENKDDKKKIVWPFPPVDVVKEKDGYELLDGRHRAEAAKVLRLNSIPANVRTIKDPGQRFLYQVTSNEHGLMLNKDQRDEAIRLLASKFQMGPTALASAFHLTKASISRIIAGKQRGKAARKKAETDTTHPKESTDEFSPKNFLERMFYITEEFSNHVRDVQTFLTTIKIPNREKLIAFAANLHVLASALEKTAKETKDAGRQTA